MSNFKFADWNPTTGTVPAYHVTYDDLISRGVVAIGNDGEPMGNDGQPLKSDNSERILVGYYHSQCASYCDGRLLVPLRHD